MKTMQVRREYNKAKHTVALSLLWTMKTLGARASFALQCSSATCKAYMQRNAAAALSAISDPVGV